MWLRRLERQPSSRKYDATYGAANLGAYSAAGYDCANIMIQAIKTAMANGAKNPTELE